MRLGIVQFGDYREAYERFLANGPETYYAQRYSVDFVSALSQRLDFVGVVSALGGEPYEATLSKGLASARIARTPRGELDSAAITSLLERWRIDRLILHSPDIGIVRWALRSRIKTLPIFADSWRIRGVRSLFSAKRLAAALSSPHFPIIANHNVPASLSLAEIGVDAGKIFPWDWPHDLTPQQHAPKSLPAEPVLVFVGTMTKTKGPADCIGAASLLRDRGHRFRMRLIGGGDYEAAARALVETLRLGDCVTVEGRKPHDEVVEILKQATLAFAPSWSAYPEGLPMTIYEALATRTPLVLSNHPMFLRFFADAEAARLAPENNPAALADAAESFLKAPEVYAAASRATAGLWNVVRCDLVWGQLIETWLADPDTPQNALRGLSLKEKLSAAG